MLTPTRMLALGLTLCLAGCSTARKTDVLEARLRSQEDMLTYANSEVERAKRELATARREAEDLRLQLADQGRPIVPAEESGAAFRTSGIQLSSLMTGGLDTDGEPGHDVLSVVLIPHDGDGELVKVPGTIEIEALDPTPPGGAQRIGHWQFDQRDVHEYWHKGVVQSGYQFQLPWQTPPRAEQVLVLAHLTTADGRRFDTTLTVKVDPPGVSTDVAPADGVQQASAQQSNPFDVSRPPAESGTAASGGHEIIWAEGEGPAAAADNASGLSRDRQARRADFFDEGPSADAQPLSPAPQRAPRPQPPLGREASKASSAAATDREIPPSIKDWWSDEDWATQEANETAPGVRTSDSFTEQTLPQYR